MDSEICLCLDIGRSTLQMDSEICLFLDTFAQHQCKITVGFVVPYHPSAWKTLAPAGWVCAQIDVQVFGD
jgi:hypothetical protein